MKHLFIILGLIGLTSHALAQADDLSAKCETIYNDHMKVCQSEAGIREDICNKVNQVTESQGFEVYCYNPQPQCEDNAQAQYKTCEYLAGKIGQ